MPQNEAGPDEEPVNDPAAAPLTGRERALAGAIGTLMIGAGTAAVFLRKVEAGPTALITLGALLIVIAISGVSIKRARIGDNEITLHARQAAALEISRTPADELDTAINVLAAYDPAAVSDPSIRSAISEAYTSAVLSNLDRVYGARFTRTPSFPSLDGIINLESGAIDVDVRHYQRSIPSESSIRLVTRLARRASSERVALICNIEFPEAIAARIFDQAFEEGKDLKIITLLSPLDRNEIQQKISAAFPASGN